MTGHAPADVAASPPRVSDALGDVLRLHRDRYNAQIADERLHGSSSVQTGVESALRGPIDSLAQAVTNEAREQVVEAAFQAALILAGRGLTFGADGASPIARTWALLPAFAAAVEDDATRAIGSLTNATAAVQRDGDVEAWMARLTALAGTGCDLPQLLYWGRVAAWTSGLAQHREQGVAVVSAAGPEDEERMSAAVLGTIDRSVDPSWNPLSRWAQPTGPSPDDGLVEGASAGGFVGFGGPFTVPPTVWVAEDGDLVASAADGDGVWTIHADAFGTVLTRRRGDVTAGQSAAAESWPGLGDDIASTACTANTQVWARPYSHRIRIRGRLAGSAG